MDWYYDVDFQPPDGCCNVTLLNLTRYQPIVLINIMMNWYYDVNFQDLDGCCLAFSDWMK